jgi:hypothetical protein
MECPLCRHNLEGSVNPAWQLNAYLDEPDDEPDEDAINLNWYTYLGASIQT